MANKPGAGRPRIKFDWRPIDVILELGGTLTDCAESSGHSEDTIQRRIKSKFKCTFSEYRNGKMSKMRMKLRQVQYQMVVEDRNPALAIWLGKQMLDQKEPGQTQKLEHSSPDGSMTPKENQVVVYLPDNGRGDGGSSNS